MNKTRTTFSLTQKRSLGARRYNKEETRALIQRELVKFTKGIQKLPDGFGLVRYSAYPLKAAIGFIEGMYEEVLKD